ncbi:MAG: macro domain-containing protein [Ruminococcus sp.]|nr:macro domain-containing protein [Ruminococcus sp.]
MNTTSLIHEERMDIFAVPKEYYIAHSISGDYSLGAGIAKKINKEYAMSYKLNAFYPNKKDKNCALLIDNVFNLVTKKTLYDRPTYDTLRNALKDMRKQCLKLGIKKIAMPHISCGMDGLSWKSVKPLIYEVFQDTDIEILICYL